MLLFHSSSLVVSFFLADITLFGAKELFDMISKAEIKIEDEILSPNAKDLLSKLLVREVADRLGCGEGGADEVKQHAFFAGVDWDAIERYVLFWFVCKGCSVLPVIDCVQILTGNCCV